MNKNSHKHEYRVRDLVIDDEFDVIGPEETIVEAAKKMKEKGIPDLVVIDPETNNPMGVIADFDIVQNVVAENLDPNKTLVKQAMYSIQPVDLDTPVIVAFTRMHDLNVNVVPVVDNGKFLGVATIQDCWSFIPDRNVDEVGMIPVKEPKYAEFWLSSICALLAFILGILLPLAGIMGFYIGSASELAPFFKIAEIRGGPINFYLFDARGSEFFESFIDLAQINGVIWWIIIINSTLFIIFGVIGLFSLFYAGFADLKGVRVGNIVRNILPSMFIIFGILSWIFLSIGLSGANVKINIGGLIFSIISMILVLIGIFRDYVFRQEKDIGKLSKGNVEVDK
ncbi:MAG: CBS domain-containing protein [Promethearchaeota archaeon]